MASVSEYLDRLQKLTQTNLDILQTINDSFFTKNNHLSVNINGSSYAIPSFISLENKINYLKENFENLVHTPETGEAFFTFDGNSRAICMRDYMHTPNSLILDNIDSYSIENNDIFKDFLTPIPYVNFSIPEIPNDITSVVIKKIIPHHTNLKKLWGEDMSTQYKYSDLVKILDGYEEDRDYTEYDTVKKLPIRKNIGSATYVIQNIIEDIIDQNLDEYITLKLRNDLDDYSKSLTYRLFDETIERNLKVGDELVTYDRSAKMIITEIRTTTNTIVVRVANGEYLNLVESGVDENISDLSKLRFFSPVDFDNDKYVKVPLEEDESVAIFISPLNDRMNVQASWGSGVLLNTKNLKSETGKKFQDYYKDNVKNIGDTLYEMVNMMGDTVKDYTSDEFDSIVQLKPVVNVEDLAVYQINKHLNDSESVKNIRALYSQKIEFTTQLNEIQSNISSKNQELAEISFDDTTNIRQVYLSQITDLTAQKNELLAAINKTSNEIVLAANNSEVPIENAKYRIRGFFNTMKFLESIGKSELNNHVIGLRVQYRYKNVDQPLGAAVSFGDEFIFSDWNDLQVRDKQRLIKNSGGKGYAFEFEDDNYKVNEPSYNQIDIPISQGETVDIRVKLVFDFGYPFATVMSSWSDIINIAFPEEFLKDVQITSIIEENNKDIENNRFNNIINDKGIPDHINDKVTDQDLIYYHKPENISSGFYTAERRIIPLKDKLSSMDASIIALQDEILGTQSLDATVSIINGNNQTILLPYQINHLSVMAYDTFAAKSASEDDKELINNGNYVVSPVENDEYVSTVFNISISNTTDHTMKLYSVFPGSRTTTINDIKHVKSGIDKKDYVSEDDGVYLNYMGIKEGDSEGKMESLLSLQTANQFITFRINDVNDGRSYYKTGNQKSSNYLSLDKDCIMHGDDPIGDKHYAFMYPKLNDKYSLCMDSDNIGSYMTLPPNSSILVPIVFEYKLKDNGRDQIYKTMSFDIRTSLYKDPVTYTFRVTAKRQSSMQDKVIESNKNKVQNSLSKSGAVKYNTVFK